VRGDGARADADGAEGRDAEQEQVSTGGRQASRRRPVLTVVVPGPVPPGGVPPGGVPQSCRHGAQNADLSDAPENESRPLWR